jgi:hypothetical protein
MLASHTMVATTHATNRIVAKMARAALPPRELLLLLAAVVDNRSPPCG